jgi:hypothetical protein
MAAEDTTPSTSTLFASGAAASVEATAPLEASERISKADGVIRRNVFDMKKLVLHIGMPKTATTTLQNNLFCASDSICYLGIARRDAERRDGLLCKTAEVATLLFLLFKSDGKYRDRRKDSLKSLCELIKDEDRTVVLSLEILIMFAQPSLVISFFAELCRLTNRKFHILCSIREQKSLYLSHYRQLFKFRELVFTEFAKRSIDNIDTKHRINLDSAMSFFTQHDTIRGSVKFPFSKDLEYSLANKDEFHTLNMYKNLVSYSDMLPREQVTILPYEQITRNISDYAARLSELMDIKMADIIEALSPGKHLNVGSKADSNTYYYPVDKSRANEAEACKETYGLTKEQACSVDAVFEEINSSLNDRHDLKLGRYDYALKRDQRGEPCREDR